MTAPVAARRSARHIDFARSGPYFAAFLALALVAFWPTYLSLGPTSSSFYTHFHAITATAWMVLLIVQPLAIRARRIEWHRILGRMSYAVAPLVLVSMAAQSRMIETRYSDQYVHSGVDGRFTWGETPTGRSRTLQFIPTVTDRGGGRSGPTPASSPSAKRPIRSVTSPAHHSRCDAEDIRAIHPVDVPLVDQPKIDLVNQGSRLKRTASRSSRSWRAANLPQLRLDQREQLIERVSATAPPLLRQQQRGHIRPERHLEWQIVEPRMFNIETWRRHGNSLADLWSDLHAFRAIYLKGIRCREDPMTAKRTGFWPYASNIKGFVSFFSGTLMLAAQAFAQPYTFVPIDVHCPATASACPAGLAPGQVAAQTSARGINSRGDIVGSYVAGGQQHGFLLADGKFTSLDFPVPGVRATIANGINARGEIVGQYTAPVHSSSNPPPEDSPLYCPGAADPACIKGFYYWRGQFSTLMFPTTVDENGQQRHHPGAIAQRITDDGDIYGCLHGHDLGPSMYGAAWTRSGTFSLLANGGQLAGAMDVPMSMNNGGTPGGGRTIVGLFVDMSNQQYGYVVRNGMLAPYAPQGANLTAIWDINPSQQFVGTFRYSGEPANKRHGFLQNPGSLVPTTLDFTCEEPTGCAGAPLGTVAFATIAFGVNPAGVVVGQYTLVSGGAVHGFVAIPPDAK